MNHKHSLQSIGGGPVAKVTIRIGRSRVEPVVYNPARRLLAAIAVRAARDVLSPSAPRCHKNSARQFFLEHGAFIADEFEIPRNQIDDFLKEAA